MVKLVVLYKKPADAEKFETHYREVHTPLVMKMPGLKKLEVAHFTGAPGGEPRYYMMAELYFESGDALKAALTSPEGKAAGKDIMGVAGDILHMSFAKVDG